MRSLALTGLVLVAYGCRSTPEPAEDAMTVAIPASYSGDASSEPIGAEPWWTTFGDPTLDAAVEAALEGNFELRQAWARLREASALSRIAGAPRYPTLDLNVSGTFQEITQLSGDAANIPIRTGEFYSLGLALGYEVDLFGRIDSELKAARLEEIATAADVRATGLLLSGSAADAWISIVEQSALEDLVDEQIEVGRQLLEVTENRFATGSGSALDVLQQRRQLEGTRAEAPRVEGEGERARHQLAVLAGRPPRDTIVDAPRRLPDLPPLPPLDVPAALLRHRPDVAAAARRVESADANVAAALADRYPRLTLSANFSFDAAEIADLFDRTIELIAASLATPLVDGGRRRAEVERRRAVLEGAMDAFQLAFLTALQEVEDALSLERRGVERLAVLESQATIAREELVQARLRYAGGVDTYLQVLAAVQNLQLLERELVTERAGLLRARSQLHRALGGAWTDQLEPPVQESENDDSSES
ncbi:MAG: efflux transporter outer membrane subunit [Planctomycetota bacterium]